jgi:predicted nucleic acid-binding protein
VRLFLDTSVLLAASGSERGASREVFRRATECEWSLLASPYVIEEVIANLTNLPATATANWAGLRLDLALVDDVLTLDRVFVFEPAKDRPILFTALAWAEVLLTLDRGDFGALLGGLFYGLPILTPGMFLERERTAGRLPEQPRLS